MNILFLSTFQVESDVENRIKYNALTISLQLAFENSGGALKLKIAEVAENRQPETLLAPSVIEILESEPMLHVS